MDADIVDAEQRARALDISTSFIVQAPAGSGKTELLTQRFLRLLAVVRHPEEICAITFTRKAAAEMRHRILAALQRAGDDEPEAMHERQTWRLARAAMAHDARHDWQLSSNPNRLRVQTFDSLAATLARQMPLLSDFGALPATTERAEPHYRTAARATLRLLDDPTLGPDIERLLVHLDNRSGRLSELLCNMLRRRDQWLAHVSRSPDSTTLNGAIESTVTEQLQRLSDHIGATQLTAVSTLATRAAANLDPDARASSPLHIWLDRDDAPVADWRDLPAWQALAELLLTREGDVRKQWTAKLGFPAPSQSGIGKEEKTRRQQAKADIQQMAHELTLDQGLALWANVRCLPPRGLDDEQLALLASLFRVLLHASAELTLAFRDAGEVDFAETSMRAQRALGTPQEPTDLALSLDYQLQHLLVDEFQDTSNSQYRLLETLTAAWQTGDGRTLFAVGDPMQSIYRFREAEVGLYLQARESGIGQLRLTPLTLSVNFRSTRGIVDWVNVGFSDIFPQSTDVTRGAVTYTAAHAFDGDADTNAVQIHAQGGKDAIREAEHVVDLVRQALRETEHGQIAILARARSHLGAIASALKTAGLAFQAVDVDPLAEQAVVRDLYYLTRALLHPADRLAWMVVLRAPWAGLDLPDLLAIGESPTRVIPARLRDPTVQARLSDSGKLRLTRLLDAIDGQLPARGRRPLRQWIEGIWLRLGGPEAAGSTAAADAQAYLALLDRFDSAGDIEDFGALEEAIADLYATPDPLADGRVQLMTMHKAKGLEFDTVILPGLGNRTRGGDSELLYWFERVQSESDNELLMAPIRSSRHDAEPISDFLRGLLRDRDKLETTRLLYVAATRAKRHLHLLGHVACDDDKGPRPPSSGSLLERLWPIVAEHFDEVQVDTADTSDSLTIETNPLSRLPAEWRVEPPPAAPDEHGDDGTTAVPIEFAWAGDTARHVGTLVHRYLDNIASDGLNAWPIPRLDDIAPRIRLALANLGVVHDELDTARDKTLRALRQTLADDTGRWILDAHDQARCEWPLTVDDGELRHFIIDRSFVDADGVRWIIDYKTGEHAGGDRDAFLDQEQERYRTQLDNYARIVRQVDDRPIRLALYFPLFSDWRVWDFAD